MEKVNQSVSNKYEETNIKYKKSESVIKLKNQEIQEYDKNLRLVNRKCEELNEMLKKTKETN